jgi:NADP-dependent 3-hydroxy acid dehydrogenase YdfG
MSQPPVILITGASSGIGEAVARLFGEQGYRVVLAARRMDRLIALSEEIVAKGGQALPVKTDVSNVEEVHSLVKLALDRMNQIDVLFNNAGLGRMGWLEDLDPIQDIQNQVNVNLLGVIQSSRAVLPHFISRRSGHIINMVSVSGYFATPTYSIYAATKFGVRGFTEALRREVGIYNVTVSGIYPGGVQNEFAEKMGAQPKTSLKTPAWLMLTSERVARSVLNLVRRPRRTLILPGMLAPPIWLNILFPGLVDWIIEKRYVKREREP